MATFIVPTSTTSPDYLQRTSLDGQDYIFRFVWNERERRWYMSIADADGVDIATGIKVVVSWSLLRKVQDSRKPPGQLTAIDVSDSETPTDPQFTDLGPGERVRLMYLDADEVAELSGG